MTKMATIGVSHLVLTLEGTTTNSREQLNTKLPTSTTKMVLLLNKINNSLRILSLTTLTFHTLNKKILDNMSQLIRELTSPVQMLLDLEES